MECSVILEKYLSWTYQIISSPHIAYGAERKLRDEPTKENRLMLRQALVGWTRPLGLASRLLIRFLKTTKLQNWQC